MKTVICYDSKHRHILTASHRGGSEMKIELYTGDTIVVQNLHSLKTKNQGRLAIYEKPAYTGARIRFDDGTTAIVNPTDLIKVSDNDRS